MGSSGSRHRGRRHLPKVHGDGSEQLGGGDAPWGPMGGISAIGNIARATKSDQPGSRRAGRVLLIAYCIPFLAFAVLVIFTVVDRL